MVYIFALVAIALSDNGNVQTIRYFSDVKDCQQLLYKIEPTINKDFVKLDCIPIKVRGEK